MLNLFQHLTILKNDDIYDAIASPVRKLVSVSSTEWHALQSKC